MTKTRNNISWMKQAKCDGHGHLFFSEMHLTTVNKARAICNECPVKKECLTYAIENDEVGVWAGTTTNQRRKIRNKTLKLPDMFWQ